MQDGAYCATTVATKPLDQKSNGSSKVENGSQISSPKFLPSKWKDQGRLKGKKKKSKVASTK